MNRKLAIGPAALLALLFIAVDLTGQANLTVGLRPVRSARAQESSDPALNWWIIAGGGAPSSGTGVTLNDTVGQPIIGSASGGGDVALAAGYWAACTAAAAVMPVVTVARDGNDVVLTWGANPANAQYQVWVATDPYFDPDAAPPTAVTADAFYRDIGAAASLANHFYIVRGLNACGAASASSDRVGEFTFGLTPGS